MQPLIRTTMHLVLPSNACPAIHPKNNASHFKVNLPETLHFPNHEIGLQRIYYAKEFATIPKMPIQVTVNQPEFARLISYDLPEGIATPEEFAVNFLENAKCSHDRFQITVENSKQLRIANQTNYDTTLRFPSELVTSFKLFEPDFNALVRREICLNSGTSLLLESRLLTGFATSKGAILARPKDGIIPEIVVLPRGYFQTGPAVVAELDKAVCKAVKKHLPTSQVTGTFNFNMATNRCRYFTPTNDILAVDLKNAAHIFGFSAPVLSHAKEAEGPIDFTQGVQTMYIYSNLVEPVIVGDVKVPLLGAVPFNRKLQGEREHYEFVNPSYLPLIKHPFDTIEVQLCDDMGVSLEAVLKGKTVLGLHIRECKRSL